MWPTLFRDLHLISFLIKIHFFLPGTMDTFGHGTKSDLNVTFEPCLPEINHDRVANNVFDLQNDFHEDRLSFPVYGSKKLIWFILGSY
jgi:hypothetical protein